MKRKALPIILGLYLFPAACLAGAGHYAASESFKTEFPTTKFSYVGSDDPAWIQFPYQAALNAGGQTLRQGIDKQRIREIKVVAPAHVGPGEMISPGGFPPRYSVWVTIEGCGTVHMRASRSGRITSADFSRCDGTRS